MVATSIAATKTQSLEAVRVLASIQVKTAWVFRVALVGIIGVGAWLVHLANESWGAPWVSVAFTLSIIAAVIGEGPLNRHSRQLHRAANETGATMESLAPIINSKAAMLLGNLNVILVLVLLWDMVARPG